MKYTAAEVRKQADEGVALLDNWGVAAQSQEMLNAYAEILESAEHAGSREAFGSWLHARRNTGKITFSIDIWQAATARAAALSSAPCVVSKRDVYVALTATRAALTHNNGCQPTFESTRAGLEAYEASKAEKP